MIQQAQPSTRSIVAHRGVSAKLPENTRSAFEAAVNCGADGIEFDIQVTSDGHLVICHNPFLDRYGHPDVEITATTLAELQALDIGRSSGRQFAGEQLMTYADLLRDFRGRVPLCVEFKTKHMTTEQIDALLTGFLRLTNSRDDMKMTGLCFDRNVLRQLHASAPWLPLVWNTNTPHHIHPRDLQDQPWLWGVGCRIGHLTRHTADMIRDFGLQLLSFTCNSDEDVLKAHDLSVDFVISDDPDRTRDILADSTALPQARIDNSITLNS